MFQGFSVDICAESDPAPAWTPLSRIMRTGGPAFASLESDRYLYEWIAMPAPIALKRLTVSRSICGTWASDQCRFAIGVTALTASKVDAVSWSSANDRLCCWKAQPCAAMNCCALRETGGTETGPKSGQLVANSPTPEMRIMSSPKRLNA